MSRLRIGIIGLGMAATKHALALADLHDRAEVAAAWSPSAARRQRFAETHAMSVCDSLDALLDDPTISLMLVLSPPFTHLDLVRRCAERGRHVLLEKPIEGTLARAEELVAFCAAADIRLGVVFQNRCRTPHLRLKALLTQGTLGRALSLSLAVRWWRPDSYFQEPGRGIKDRDGGGVLLTQAIHMLDQMVDLVGLPADITGFVANSGLRAIDTEDIAAASMRWPDGALGVLDATTTRFPTTGERLDIAAEYGSATLERDRLTVRLKDGTAIDLTEDPADPAVTRDYLAHRRLLLDMFDAIADHRAPIADGADALRVHRLIEALQGASQSGTSKAVT